MGGSTIYAFFLIIVINVAVSKTTLLYRPIKNYRLDDTTIPDVNLTAAGWANVDNAFECGSDEMKCIVHCRKMENCKSVSIRKDISR